MSKFDDMMDYGENRENRKRFHALKENLDVIIPFVGAGLSVPFGFPQWKKFLLDCCENNDVMKGKVNEILNSGKSDCYEEAASYLSKELTKENPDFFHQKIQEVFDKDIDKNIESPITLFSSLFKGPIVTTNFDRVLETVTGYKTVLYHQEENFSRFLKGTDKNMVLKLHGDVKDVKNIILTQEQYNKSYLLDTTFQKDFFALLESKIFLFLGCSLDQDRTMAFMSRPEAVKWTQHVKNYAFMASPAFRFKNIKEKTEEIKEEEELAKQKEKEIEERLGKVNILPIWYPEGEYQWIQSYLEWLGIEENYLKVFEENFDTPLFLEYNYEKRKRITLRDIYTDPDFVFLNEKEVQENLSEIIYYFMDNTLSDELKRKRKTTDSILNTLFILGEPGIGKSSLISKIVVESKVSRENEFYCLRLRDLDKETISLEGALNAILKILSIQENDLKEKTLLLDGVDELCGIENYKKSIDDFCFSLMEEANRLKFKLLFTSRLNYVHLEDERFNTMLVLKLLPFGKKQFEYWFHQYHAKRSQRKQACLIKENLFMLCNAKEEEEKKKLELFGIPLVLYLLVELKVDISKINSLGQLYNKLFKELKNRLYDNRTNKDTLPKLLYKNCKEIAKHIAKKMFDTKEDMLNSESYREAIMLLPDKLKSNLNDILDYEHFYLLSFYYRIDKEKCSVEFIHKSLMEYLVGEMLYYCLSQILNSELNEEKQKEELQKELDKFFTFSVITDEICLFFLEKVKENGKQQQLFSLLKKYYKFYLEVGFIYEISNNINSLTKIQNLFISYWKLLRILANTKKDNLLEEEKDLFCSYLTKISFENIDLSYQNLAKTKLSRVDLSRADLSGADLSGADLNGAFLNGTFLNEADLSEASLNEANLNGADLKKAKLNKVFLKKAKLNKADLSGADLSEADLNGAFLNEAKLNGTLLNRTFLNEADLNGADLSEAFLSGTYLIGAYLKKAKLNKADLSGAFLNEAFLNKAYLNEVDLRGAFLNEAFLNKTYLKKAKLNKADLSGANLREAFLNKADLSKASLREANLNKADLNEANLREAFLNKTDLSKASLREADLNEASLNETDLSKAFLSGADLSKAFLSKVDLSKAKLNGAKLPISLRIKRIFIPLIKKLFVIAIAIFLYFLFFK